MWWLDALITNDKATKIPKGKNKQLSNLQIKDFIEKMQN